MFEGMMLQRVCAACLLLTGTVAMAGGRPRYGGQLDIAAITKSNELDPLFADSPVEAALSSLSSTPICRLTEFSRPSPLTLRLTTVHAALINTALTRAKTEATPYRAFLTSIKAISVTSTGLDLALDAPAPWLEEALCHPSLSVPLAPYVKGAANSRHPAGRPYPDTLVIQRTDSRTAERLLTGQKTQVVVGSAAASDAPQLFATYAVVAPGKDMLALRDAIDATTERADLARFFVRPPASPLFSILPPALGGSTAAPPRLPKPSPQKVAREVMISFDGANDDHRAIAEKLQVKLQPLGFRLSLKPLTKNELWASLPPGNAAALSLRTVLLPASVPAAMTVLSSLGYTTEANAAVTLVIPLCVQGVGVSTANDVQNFHRDSLGLPRLDDVFLSSE